MNNKIIILTGDKQTGKTTLLQQFCKQQKKVAGILSPVINDKRMFYNITGNEFFKMEADTNEPSLTIGRYSFSEKAFIKANHIINIAVKKSTAEYLILDEIGPLEIQQQTGLISSLQQILSTSFQFTLILVVRLSLVDEFVSTLKNYANVSVFDIKEMKTYFKLDI